MARREAHTLEEAAEVGFLGVEIDETPNEAYTVAAFTTRTVEDDDRPLGNASTDEWHEYRLAHGYTAVELADLGRNDLRDLADR